MEIEGSKDALLNNSVKVAVDTAKKTLEALKSHLNSLGTVGDSTNKVVGEVTSQQSGAVADT
ncbi:Variable major outer membrane lipoprotein (plasmid) [Borrelia crocidurae DOU]|uniref:Variable major outer membrane lipoprotein n=1 Tax=Borrelia crocidurae DOU TaxID=1293575 RepID=W5SII7_9SPIR|nr:Variable major outer membrane lipoprotein [Borrelia crocidurae DOU]